MQALNLDTALCHLLSNLACFGFRSPKFDWGLQIKSVNVEAVVLTLMEMVQLPSGAHQSLL